jgi:hypothetical protein
MSVVLLSLLWRQKLVIISSQSDQIHCKMTPCQTCSLFVARMRKIETEKSAIAAGVNAYRKSTTQPFRKIWRSVTIAHQPQEIMMMLKAVVHKARGTLFYGNSYSFSRDKSRRLSGGMKRWASILILTFGTIRAAESSAVRAVRCLPQGNSLVLIYVTRLSGSQDYWMRRKDYVTWKCSRAPPWIESGIVRLVTQCIFYGGA